MSEALVPYKPPFSELQTSHLEFQTKLFQENRNLLLNELRYLTGIPSIMKELKLNPTTVYKIVNTPEGGELFKDVAGNFKGVFYKDGKIIQHARLRAISPSMIKAASAIGYQILLISIAMQLNQIERKLDRIINELQISRISKINSGIHQFEDAMLAQNKDNQRGFINNAIQSISDGLNETLEVLKEQINCMIDPKIIDKKKSLLLENWGIDSITDRAEIKFKPAAESLYACLLGIKNLSECYAALDEHNIAENVLKRYLTNLKDANIESAAKKAQLVRPRGNVLPETPWKEFLACQPILMKRLNSCKAINEESIDKVEIEFKPEELLP